MAKERNEETQSKLVALQRSYEVEERRALEEKKRIDEVLDVRARAVEELERAHASLADRLRQLKGGIRRDAIQRGDALQLSSMEGFRGRLQSELAALERQLEERRRELQQARERSDGMQQEIIEVRIEKKKVERIIQSRAEVARVRKEATEEALTDEMNFFRNKK